MSEHTVEEILADAREIYGVFGKAERALRLVNQALEAEPDNVEALNLRASIFYELDRDDEAEADHRRALTIEPCSVEALHGLASLANDGEQYEQALSWIARGFACLPQDPHPELKDNEDFRQRLIAELYCEKGFALWYLGRHEEAEQVLTEEGPQACPLEVETLEDQYDWLQHHPEHPEE
jgi:tetratricopeptide (TPR) repeat protein